MSFEELLPAPDMTITLTVQEVDAVTSLLLARLQAAKMLGMERRDIERSSFYSAMEKFQAKVNELADKEKLT